MWSGPRPIDARPFDELATRVTAIVATVHQRSPRAVVVLVRYPRVLPANGSCAGVEVSEPEASWMRGVADRLAQVTRSAASRSQSIVVDMASESVGHDACSGEPWVNGSAPGDGAMFRPNLTGARERRRPLSASFASCSLRVASRSTTSRRLCDFRTA